MWDRTRKTESIVNIVAGIIVILGAVKTNFFPNNWSLWWENLSPWEAAFWISLIVFVSLNVRGFLERKRTREERLDNIQQDIGALAEGMQREAQNRVAAIDGLGERLNRAIAKLETFGFKEERKEQKAAPAHLPLCPLEIVFDPSNNIYRKFIEEESPLSPMFGKQKRKIWYFEMWNEPPSHDVMNVSVCVDVMETIPSKPGGIVPPTQRYGRN